MKFYSPFVKYVKIVRDTKEIIVPPSRISANSLQVGAFSVIADTRVTF